MSAGKVLLVTMIGMATGAVLAVLFAPEKETIRRKISKQGTQYMDDLNETASQYVDILEENLDGIRETAVDFSLLQGQRGR